MSIGDLYNNAELAQAAYAIKGVRVIDFLKNSLLLDMWKKRVLLSKNDKSMTLAPLIISMIYKA